MLGKISHRGFLALGLLLGDASQAGIVSYKYTDLGTNGRTSSVATAINNAGQIVGWTDDAHVDKRATVWNGATLIDLGYGQAMDINDAGQVVGASFASPETYTVTSPTLWNGTTATLLTNPRNADTPNPGGYPGSSGIGADSVAYSINNAGVIVGQGVYGAALWRGATQTYLQPSSRQLRSTAMAINNVDQAVGSSRPAKIDNTFAELWNGTTAVHLPGSWNPYANVENYAEAYGINDAGMAVGGTNLDGGKTGGSALSWKDGVVTILSGLGGDYARALGVNTAGQVVGEASAPYQQHAVVWNGPVPTDLNTYLDANLAKAGWVLSSANGINDAGAIVGTATHTTTYATRAFLLTPVSLACTATYKVTKTQAFSFAVQVTVANVSSAPLSNWTVGWTYSPKTLLLSIKNAKVTLSGGALVAASPVAANKTIAANGSTVFTFTGLKGSQLPTPNELKASLGGNVCAVAVQ